MSADSVKENFDLLGFGNKELGVVPVSAYWGGYLRTEVIDPSTVKVTLDKPSAGFLQGLSMYFAGILGHTTLQLRKEDRALPQNIVATGPFVVTEHVYQEKTVLRKREGYNWEPASRGHNGAAAYTRSSWLSQAIASLPAAGVSVPVFLVGLAILQVFSFQLRWFPPIGNDGFASLVLPAVTLAIPVSAPIAQLLLKNIELGLNAPYVTVSVAKGASRLWVLVRDVLENASLPALTIAGLTLGNLPAGAAHVERRRGLVRQ
ncbi:ABC transporter permease subunit [Rhodococcus sp. USK10]|uniref:ABC transporter permease subunit n=1 Tax=Rhodococcus sp. USK10 TaxID=2789739 RepID=UPI0035B564B0